MASAPVGENLHFVETNQLISELQDQMQCAICQERLKKPRVLACLHSFCEECLKRSHRLSARDFMDSDSDSEEIDYPIIKCPYCREVTELLDDGISGLKADFRANKVGEILDALEDRKRKFVESEYSCEICTSSRESHSVPASHYCQDCGQLFCEQCSKVHQKLTDTKEHFVLKVTDLMNGKVKLRKTEHEDVAYKMCRQHAGEPLKYFCRACKSPVCFVCSSFGKCMSHKKELCPFDEAVTEMSGIVEMLTDQLKHRQRSVEDMMAKSNRIIGSTENRKQASIQQMIAKRQAIINQLNMKMQRVVNDREMLYNGKISRVKCIAAEMQKMNEKSKNALHLADNVQKGGQIHGTDLVTVLGCLQGALQTVPAGKMNTINLDLSKIEDDVQRIPTPQFTLGGPNTEGPYRRIVPRGQTNMMPARLATTQSPQLPMQRNTTGSTEANWQPLFTSTYPGATDPNQERIGSHSRPHPLQERTLPSALSRPTAQPQPIGYSISQPNRRLASSSFLPPQTTVGDLHHQQSSSNPTISPLLQSTTSCSTNPNVPASTSLNGVDQPSVSEPPLPPSGAIASECRLLQIDLAEIDLDDIPDLGPDLSI